MTDELRADSMTGEQWVFEERTADPATTMEGERWLRTDLTPETNQIATLRVDVGGSVVDVPVFATGTSETGVDEALRLRVGGQTGYIPITTPADAAFNNLRMQHNGSTLAYHNRVEPGSAIPDSVTSRPADNNSASVTDSIGLTITTDQDFSAIGAVFSANTSNPTRARLYDYTQDSYISSIDVSGLTSGDAFSFDHNIQSNREYGIELDGNGGSWTLGYRSDEEDYPYTGEDVDITGRSNGGTKETSGGNGIVASINDIGNPDNILD